MRLLQVLVVALLLPFSAMAANGTPAICEITAKGERVDGPCRFSPRRGGSFDISMADERPMGGAMSLSLDIVSRGVGEVRGVTPFGVRSRWGEARRQAEDGACWRGADFTLCVRAVGDSPPALSPVPGIFAGRCHMDACSWIDQPPAREIGSGSAAVPGRRVETTMRMAQSLHPGGAYPDAPPQRLAWSAPQPMQFFCSTVRPAFRNMDGSWMVLPLPQVFGATESMTRQYLQACHPGTAAGDPYETPAALGYTSGMPRRDMYPTFDALTRN